MRSIVGWAIIAGISIVLVGAWWGLRHCDDAAAVLPPISSAAERTERTAGRPNDLESEAMDSAVLRSDSVLDRGSESEADPHHAAPAAPPVMRSFLVVGPYRVPVEGAVASFFAASEAAPPGARIADAVSGRNGTFDVTLPAEQPLLARVEAAGFTTEEWWMPPLVGDADWIDLVTLEPLSVRSIDGELVTPEGRPLPREVLDLLRGTGASPDGRLDPRESTRFAPATVVFEPSGIGVPDRVADGARDVRPRESIDESGAFGIPRQPVGVAGTLRLQWCGRELSSAAWTGRESRTQLVVDPSVFGGSLASLDVVVTGFGGATDFDWLTVLLWSVDGQIAFDRRIARGDTRPLRFANLSPGRYVVEVRTRDVLACASTMLEPGEHEAIELDATSPARLTIDVVGWPTSCESMPAVLAADGFGREAAVRPRPGEPVGAFVAEVPAGRYVVALNGEARLVDVVAGGTANVRLAWSAATFVGFEIVADSGARTALAPWVEAWLTLEREDGVCLRREWLDLAIEDDGSARVFVPLAPGDYVVRVERDGATVEQAFTVAAGDQERVVRLRRIVRALESKGRDG